MMAKFKPYVPPATMPKTIRKGMTMDKFPLSAWPIFSRIITFKGMLGRDNYRYAVKYPDRAMTTTEEIKPYTAAQRRKQVALANAYIGDNLDDMEEGDHDYWDWEGWADENGINPAVFVIVWDNQPALKKRGNASIDIFKVAKATKITTPRKLTEIVWSTYDGSFLWVQTISGRSSVTLVFEGDSLEYSYFRAMGVADMDLLIEYMRGPYGFIPWDDEGRAYIEFDGQYTATVRSISQLHDFLERESDDHTEAKILEVTEDSPFSSDNLVMALLMHGIEAE